MPNLVPVNLDKNVFLFWSQVELHGVADQVRADPAPRGDVLEGLVNDADNGHAFDRDADHRRDVLKQIFGVLLRRVERVDPDRDVVEGNDYIVLLSYDVVNLYKCIITK